MKFLFNEAQLSRPQRESLLKILGELQVDNENELVVTPVEFPIKLLVMLDDNVGIPLFWDAEKKCYFGLTTPESEIDTVDIPEPEHGTEILSGPEPERKPGPEPLPTPELVKSEVGQRVEALALALAKLAKPFDFDQRLEIWIQFCKVLFKEFMK